MKFSVRCSYVLLAFISFFAALFGWKIFKLALTLPIFFVALSCFFVYKSFPRLRVFSTLAANASVLLLGVSVLSSLFNLLHFKPSPAFQAKQLGAYGSPGTWIPHEASMGLGYSYKPMLRNYSSTKVGVYKNGEQFPIYDVLYNIDSRSNRSTPTSGYRETNRSSSILFLGGSFTFGEGLNDNQTLSYYIQLLTNRGAINAGMHGYGTHQSLKILEDDQLFSYKTDTATVSTVIYRFIDGHIKRAAGYSPWDKHGPCYEVNNNQSVVYKGSFAGCKAFHNSFLEDHILKRLTNSSEAWTNKFFKKFSYKQRYISSSFEDKDYARLIAMTREMKKLSDYRGAKFIFLYDDFKSCDSVNKRSLEKFDLVNDLKNLGVTTVATSEIYSGDKCADRELRIPHDGHPAARANLLIARFLHENKLL